LRQQVDEATASLEEPFMDGPDTEVTDALAEDCW
jgi:hypothetical protein